METANMIKRMHQIKQNREKFREKINTHVLDSKSFMSMVEKYADTHGKYMFNDDPLCAYMGILDITKDKCYFCAIEDLTELEIKKIDSFKPRIP